MTSFGLTASMLIGCIPGVYIGARFSSRAPDGVIRPALVFVLLGKSGKLSPDLASVLLRYFIALNLVLMFFNLIPLPPLDGGAVLAGILPESLQFIPRALERYGMILFFVLFLSGVLAVFMRPAYALIGIWSEALRRAVAA